MPQASGPTQEPKLSFDMYLGVAPSTEQAKYPVLSMMVYFFDVFVFKRDGTLSKYCLFSPGDTESNIASLSSTPYCKNIQLFLFFMQTEVREKKSKTWSAYKPVPQALPLFQNRVFYYFSRR